MLQVLVDSDDYTAFMKELLGVTEDLIRGRDPVDPRTYRKPYVPELGTWNEAALTREIRAHRSLARTRLENYYEGDGRPVVVSLRNGSGFGKTHILTEAPKWLTAKGIYITYNQGQDLRSDCDYPIQAAILRLILVLRGFSPRQCSNALTREEVAPFLRVSVYWLEKLFVNTCSTDRIGDIVISVDEVRKLPNEAARIMLSALSSLAARFVKETQNMCTVLVSSLNSETFRTVTGRAFIKWNVERPNDKTLEFFAYLLRENKKKAKALANALGGGHMRSLVYCFKMWMDDEVNVSMKYLLNRMDQEYDTNIDDKDLVDVQLHVLTCIRSREAKKTPATVEEMSGVNHAVPPCYIMKAFQDNPAATQILHDLFGSFSLYNTPGKQLEEIGKQYDLLRAALDLPVVPGRAEVTIPCDSQGTRYSRSWYRNLQFTSALVVNEAALLKQQNVEGSTTKEIAATGVRPECGCYYYPSICIHPWINRLFVAWNPDHSEECLVIILDKVSSPDFASACEKLQQAADVLTAAHNIANVLLIVNVIGERESTRAQCQLTWPHILVGEDEVPVYYTVNFADIALYARKRHQVSV